MDSSQYLDNNWSCRIPGTKFYGEPDVSRHITHPLPWKAGWSIKTSTGCSIIIEDVVYGSAYISVCYPHNALTNFFVLFPKGIEIDDIEAFGFCLKTNIIFFKYQNAIYYTCLDLPMNDDYHIFKKW
jgi:hypothetical protein